MKTKRIKGMIKSLFSGCYFLKYAGQHQKRVEKHISGGRRIYYIIRYQDTMNCGWTVWERVVLYNCIYAQDHKMIPVVDMKNYPSIYQNEEDFQKINIWDLYYEQPGGVSVEEAYQSGNYILCDDSDEWFRYIRVRKYFDTEYLRKAYQRYIRLNRKTRIELQRRYETLLPSGEKSRMVCICLRGTDYVRFHHPRQPGTEEIVTEAREIFQKYHCDYYYVATEDARILKEIRSCLEERLIVQYKAGNVTDCDGYIGLYLQQKNTAYDLSMDYLTVLFMMKKCVCLVGGICGATIVAEYGRKEPYEYIHLIDMHKNYK